MQHPKPLTATSAEQERRALEMRAAGCTYDQIADALGMTASGAWKVAQRALARVPSESADELRLIESARLDALTARYLPAAMSGDLSAAAFVLKVAERRSRLHGLDAPNRVQVAAQIFDGDMIDAETARLLRLLEADQDGRLIVLDGEGNHT